MPAAMADSIDSNLGSFWAASNAVSKNLMTGNTQETVGVRSKEKTCWAWVGCCVCMVSKHKRPWDVANTLSTSQSNSSFLHSLEVSLKLAYVFFWRLGTCVLSSARLINFILAWWSWVRTVVKKIDNLLPLTWTHAWVNHTLKTSAFRHIWQVQGGASLLPYNTWRKTWMPVGKVEPVVN